VRNCSHGVEAASFPRLVRHAASFEFVQHLAC
jgi:hypothetical protein